MLIYPYVLTLTDRVEYNFSNYFPLCLFIHFHFWIMSHNFVSREMPSNVNRHLEVMLHIQINKFIMFKSFESLPSLFIIIISN